MTRDTLNALITAILMVIGLIALEPGILRGDRHSTLNPCQLFDICAPPEPNPSPKLKKLAIRNQISWRIFPYSKYI